LLGHLKLSFLVLNLYRTRYKHSGDHVRDFLLVFRPAKIIFASVAACARHSCHRCTRLFVSCSLESSSPEFFPSCPFRDDRAGCLIRNQVYGGHLTLIGSASAPYLHLGRTRCPCAVSPMQERLMTRERLTSGPFRSARMSGWRMIGLFLCCLFLSALAAALAGIIGTAPQWMPILMR